MNVAIVHGPRASGRASGVPATRAPLHLLHGLAGVKAADECDKRRLLPPDLTASRGGRPTWHGIAAQP